MGSMPVQEGSLVVDGVIDSLEIDAVFLTIQKACIVSANTRKEPRCQPVILITLVKI